MAGTKMPNSPSPGVGTNLRCPSHSGALPGLACGTRLGRRMLVGHLGSCEGVVTSHHPTEGRAAREPSVAVALGWLS